MATASWPTEVNIQCSQEKLNREIVVETLRMKEYECGFYTFINRRQSIASVNWILSDTVSIMLFWDSHFCIRWTHLNIYIVSFYPCI